MGIKAITGLIPIHLHFKKLSGKHQLWSATLSYNYTIKLLFKKRYASQSQLYCLFLDYMFSKQQQRIKSSIVNVNNCLNRIFLSFDLLNCKLHPGVRLIDIFFSHISFYKTNHSSNESKIAHCVVATTRPMSNESINNKSLSRDI